jgi:hypothetical protein
VGTSNFAELWLIYEQLTLNAWFTERANACKMYNSSAVVIDSHQTNKKKHEICEIFVRYSSTYDCKHKTVKECFINS